MNISLRHFKNQKKGLQPSQSQIAEVLNAYQEGQYAKAEQITLALLKHFPNHPFLWKVLGAAVKQAGNLNGSLEPTQRAAQLAPADPECHNNLGVTLLDLGRLSEAEKSFNTAVKLKPDYVEGYSNLGTALQKLGKLNDSVLNFNKAISLNPNFPDTYNNLGVTLQILGRTNEAQINFRKAIELRPGYAEAYYNLGNALKELGKLDEAITIFNIVISHKPNFAEAYINLGATQKDLGRLYDAEASFKRAISLNSNQLEAYNNLGVILLDLGRINDSKSCFHKALTLKPDFAEAHSNLSVVLLQNNEPLEALHSIIRALDIQLSFEAKGLFIEVTKKVNPKFWDPSVARIVVRALIEPWGRPFDLMPYACRLLKTHPEFINSLNFTNSDSFLSDSSTKNNFDFLALLNTLLISSHIADVEVELFLTDLRRNFINKVKSKPTDRPSKETHPLYSSLAQQCFINEYVFYQTPSEEYASSQLKSNLIDSISQNLPVDSDLLIAVSCYYPLHSIKGIINLLNHNWPDHISSLLSQQVKEPLKELELKSSVPCLTNIDDEISVAVQNQYEENPYPRWTKLPANVRNRFLNAYIHSKFPNSSFQPLKDDSHTDILIAGCGTGQHPIETSQIIKGSSVLAIDLSSSSLAYAKRKTEELKIHSINYAQADILKLNTINRKFDCIESSGVLHHLHNPKEGLEVLLNLLRPNGLMRLGFYSQIARQDIIKVRELILQEKIGSSSKDIRNYRKKLLETSNQDSYGFAISSTDFFTTSGCRDLLFHVQEHCFDLNTLHSLINKSNCNFLGFELNRSVIQNYKMKFPKDIACIDLNNWEIFERANPHTFIGMYQFWVQKN